MRRRARNFVWNSLLLLSFVATVRSRRIPLIGLFTREQRENNSSSPIIDYARARLKSIAAIHTELDILRPDEDIPCDMAIGTKLVFDMLHQRPRPLAIFSGSCQTVASAIAETAGMLDMTIVRLSSERCTDRVLSPFEDHLLRDEFAVHRAREVPVVDPHRTWRLSTQRR